MSICGHPSAAVLASAIVRPFVGSFLSFPSEEGAEHQSALWKARVGWQLASPVEGGWAWAYLAEGSPRYAAMKGSCPYPRKNWLWRSLLAHSKQELWCQPTIVERGPLGQAEEREGSWGLMMEVHPASKSDGVEFTIVELIEILIWGTTIIEFFLTRKPCMWVIEVWEVGL